MQDADRWAEQARLVFGRLNEQQRRLVAGLLSNSIGFGGDTFLSRATGLDAKTVKRGREELDDDLQDCPAAESRRQACLEHSQYTGGQAASGTKPRADGRS